MRPTPSDARVAMRRAIGNVSLYPDDSARDYRAKVAERYAVPPESVFAASGSVEVLELLAIAFDPGRDLIQIGLRKCFPGGRDDERTQAAAQRRRPHGRHARPVGAGRELDGAEAACGHGAGDPRRLLGGDHGHRQAVAAQTRELSGPRSAHATGALREHEAAGPGAATRGVLDVVFDGEPADLEARHRPPPSAGPSPRSAAMAAAR
jgi:hypothetical protein